MLCVAPVYSCGLSLSREIASSLCYIYSEVFSSMSALGLYLPVHRCCFCIVVDIPETLTGRQEVSGVFTILTYYMVKNMNISYTPGIQYQCLL